MIKIKISSGSQSDVTDMRAKGWHLMVFRGIASDDDFITVAKNDVRFVMRVVKHDNEKYLEIAKYLDGVFKESKQFYENGCGIRGTLCISEGKEPDLTYAFFRNEKLQDIIDEFGLRRIIFPREPGDHFEKEVQVDLDKYKQYTGEHPTAPSFHTDGTYEEIPSDNRRLKKWKVSNATYIYEYNTGTLTIPQKYDTNKIWQTLEELMN